MAQFLLLSDTHFGFSRSTRKIWAKYWKEVIAVSPEFDRLDALILAGDVASHQVKHLRSAFKFFRGKMGDKPIFWVRGNHDYWDGGLKNLRYLIDKTSKIAAEHTIHGLHCASSRLGNTLMVGWDCWYTAHPGQHTQDLSRIPGRGWDSHALLSSHSLTGFVHMREEVANRAPDIEKVICVTHMPGGYTERHIGQSLGQWELAIEDSDVVCYGHTHRRDERKVGSKRILNAGSDYDKPNHIFFAV